MKLKPDQTKTANQLLRVLPLFSGCPGEALQEMVDALETHDMPAGKVVLMDQELGRTLYLLVAGRVGVWKRVGHEKKELASLEGPDFFGERSMFEESLVTAQIKTQEPCTLFTLERTAFEAIAKKYPGISETIRTNMIAIRQQRFTPATERKEES